MTVVATYCSGLIKIENMGERAPSENARAEEPAAYNGLAAVFS